MQFFAHHVTVFSDINYAAAIKTAGVVLASVMLSHAAFSKDINTTIDSVVVYPVGAMVTRIATLDIPAGATEIELVNLPGALKLQDLQLQILDESVEIGQVSLNQKQQRDAYNEKVTVIREKITAEEFNKQILADENEAAKLRLKFIESVSQGYAKEAWTAGAKGTTNVSSWNDALALIQSGSNDANQLIRNNSQNINTINKEISKLKRQLSHAHGVSLASSELNVTVNAKKAASTKVLLHYYQAKANWKPSYEARLDSNSGSLSLAQQAIVNQSTDENWNNVKLILSTSEPTGELEAPKIYSEILNLYNPALKQKRASFNDTAMSLRSSLEEVIISAEKDEDYSPQVDINIGVFAVNYDIPGRASVPNSSANDLHFDLSRDRVDVDLVSKIVPRESTDAFLAARFTHKQDLPMYAGDMRIFVDGVYVGISKMPDVLPQAEITLPMGQDRRIDVQARSQVGKEGTAGIISKRNTESVDYLFTINNRRDTNTLVEVYDRYPIARNKAIEISIPRSATAPTEQDIENQPGVIVWRKELNPSATFEIKHQYTVSYPSKSKLTTDYQ